MNRRQFVSRSTAAGIGAAAYAPRLLCAPLAAHSIDRARVVRRHSPEFTSFHPYHALSVGSGEFAFTADITGLQTFSTECEVEFPLCTAAHWGWHTSPGPAGLQDRHLKLHDYNAHGRSIGYATDKTGQEALFDYLRTNEHKFHLGRIGFEFELAGAPAIKPSDLRDIHQQLDLWSGLIQSRFTYGGKPVRVLTCAHPERDSVAVRIESPLLASGQLRVRIAFPYASPERSMADWTQPELHTTVIVRASSTQTLLERRMDATRYSVAIGHPGKTRLVRRSAHEFVLDSPAEALEFTCAFSPTTLEGEVPAFTAAQSASEQHWQSFWMQGGFLDLDGSTHPAAEELERRTVLSLYNTALHCSGSLPSAETGLLCNSWYGKFHLEMHWWHGVHFATWNRFPLFERSLGYYQSILPVAQELARTQGYQGARWPKMTDRSGRDSPSPVGPLLIWQQPHPIYYAELAYRAKPTRATLEQWRDVVFATAEFLADYAALDTVSGQFVLGPPLKTVSENTDPLHAHNPAFELAYWRFGLRVAQTWRQRLNLPAKPRWGEVASRLAPLPTNGGLYLLEDSMTDTYTKWNWEHPAHLGAFGMQPGDGVDPAIMRESLRRTMDVWRWDTSWGWDFPMAALCAARVGDPELAVKALLIHSPKNRYHPNGHNYQRADLTAYLPGNGGFLSAIGMMAKGWTSGPNSEAPGFPRNRQWNVRSEGLRTWL